MKYKFPLQRVLDLRQEREDALAKIRDEVQQVLVGLKEVLNEELGCYFGERERFNQTLAEGKVVALPLLERGLEFRKQRMVDILSRVRQVESDLSEIDAELFEARKGVKVVEKLKEKREVEFWEMVESKDRKMLDEMAVMRHSRRERGEL